MTTIKTLLLPVLLAFLFAGVGYAGNQFILVTKEVRWDDGLVSRIGEVELVTEYTERSYVVWVPNTEKRYEVPRTQAKKISADDAALRLLVQRQQLYAEKNAVAALLQQGGQQQNELDQAEQVLRILQQLQQLTERNDQDLLNQIEQLKRLQEQR